ncbi:hypothetical protein MAHJHV28_46930 [Mycobacterium avium subsp. hominissuis]
MLAHSVATRASQTAAVIGGQLALPPITAAVCEARVATECASMAGRPDRPCSRTRWPPGPRRPRR